MLGVKIYGFGQKNLKKEFYVSGAKKFTNKLL